MYAYKIYIHNIYTYIHYTHTYIHTYIYTYVMLRYVTLHYINTHISLHSALSVTHTHTH